MKIEVLGSGCKKCKELYERTQKAVQLLGFNVEVEYITNVQKIIDMGLVSSPVLVINDKPVLVGILPDKDKLKQIIFESVL